MVDIVLKAIPAAVTNATASAIPTQNRVPAAIPSRSQRSSTVSSSC